MRIGEERMLTPSGSHRVRVRMHVRLRAAEAICRGPARSRLARRRRTFAGVESPHGRIARFSREEKISRWRGGCQARRRCRVRQRPFARVAPRDPRTGGSRSRAPGEPLGAWHEALARAAGGLTGEEILTRRAWFSGNARVGITCVGEFHELHHQPDGTAWPEPNFLAQEILRAAHDVGIRIALFRRGERIGGPSRTVTASADQFVRETEALRFSSRKISRGRGVAWCRRERRRRGAAGFSESDRDLRARAEAAGACAGVGARADNEACVAAHGAVPSRCSPSAGSSTNDSPPSTRSSSAMTI